MCCRGWKILGKNCEKLKGHDPAAIHKSSTVGSSPILEATKPSASWCQILVYLSLFHLSSWLGTRNFWCVFMACHPTPLRKCFSHVGCHFTVAHGLWRAFCARNAQARKQQSVGCDTTPSSCVAPSPTQLYHANGTTERPEWIEIRNATKRARR